MPFADRRLADMIAQLPERDKVVATLSLYEQLDVAAVADQLGVTEFECTVLMEGVNARLADVLPVSDREARALQRRLIERLAGWHAGSLNTRRQFASARESVVSSVPGPELRAALEDVRQGDGGELRAPKTGGSPSFHSIRSSCALAVSSFGLWRLDPSTLALTGKSGFEQLVFEAKFPISDSRFDTPPNVDVVCWSPQHAVAVESKFVEYIDPKHSAVIGDKYDRQIEAAHPSWQEKVTVLRESPDEYRFFNAAQIIKHYLGLKRDKPELLGTRHVTLLYLYWEPSAAEASHPLFLEHRAEVADFSSRLADPRVKFASRAYPELWAEWAERPEPVASHARTLAARYVQG